MNINKLVKKILIIILAVVLIIFIVRVKNYFFLSRYSKVDLTDLFNSNSFSNDPFGEHVKRGLSNCGESRYKFNTRIYSKEDFVKFVRNNYINEFVDLDNYRNKYIFFVNWNEVLASIKTKEVRNPKTVGDKFFVYSLEYKTKECNPFTLTITTEGYVSVAGCTRPYSVGSNGPLDLLLHVLSKESCSE